MDQERYEFIVGPSTLMRKPDVKHDEHDLVVGIQRSRKRRSRTILVRGKGSMGSTQSYRQ